MLRSGAMPNARSLVRTLLIGAVALLAGMGASGCATAQVTGVVEPVAPSDAPAGMAPEAWTHALAAHQRATLDGSTRSSLLTVIDYTLPATERRLWVVDLASGEVLAHEYVAHGARSGGLYAERFSNRSGSNQSSLGAFVTAGTYHGVRGLSLRLRGLEPGFNDRAWDRAIVLHGTPNVGEARARLGTMGRTQGCPAVSTAAAREIIPLIEGGSVVYVWYPDPDYLARSGYVDPVAAAMHRASGAVHATGARGPEARPVGAGS